MRNEVYCHWLKCIYYVILWVFCLFCSQKCKKLHRHTFGFYRKSTDKWNSGEKSIWINSFMDNNLKSPVLKISRRWNWKPFISSNVVFQLYGYWMFVYKCVFFGVLEYWGDRESELWGLCVCDYTKKILDFHLYNSHHFKYKFVLFVFPSDFLLLLVGFTHSHNLHRNQVCQSVEINVLCFFSLLRCHLAH